MKHQAEVLGVVTIERLYEPVPFARVFVCSVRQDGLQVYIRTYTPAYEQDRVGFRGSRLRLYIRLLMCPLQHESSWKFVACSSSALWLRSVGHGYCAKVGSADTVTGNDAAWVRPVGLASAGGSATDMPSNPAGAAEFTCKPTSRPRPHRIARTAPGLRNWAPVWSRVRPMTIRAGLPPTRRPAQHSATTFCGRSCLRIR